MIWFCCEHFEELPELLHFTADRHLPMVAASCAFVLVGDQHMELCCMLLRAQPMVAWETRPSSCS